MVDYHTETLANGLKVIWYPDDSTPFVHVNVLYRVGSKNEVKGKTGLAHLFEHLMFTGSAAAPDYDIIVQRAGGDNNAFTNNDFTDYHCSGFASNLESLLFLEADRMHNLDLNRVEFEIQQKVVIEEFYESCLDEPYGDMWHLLGPAVYGDHPYAWPVIGASPDEVKSLKFKDCRTFYRSYYQPANASLTIAGRYDPGQAAHLVHKWFGSIPAPGVRVQGSYGNIAPLPASRQIVTAGVPASAIYMAFPIPHRTDPSFYAIDLLSDILASGKTSRLYARLVRDRQIFTDVDCYTSDVEGPGMLIIEARVNAGIDADLAEAELWREIDIIRSQPVSAYELRKVTNKTLALMDFAENSPLNVALNLSYFDYLGDISLINREYDLYRKVTVSGIMEAAKQVLRRENCHLLTYQMQLSG